MASNNRIVITLDKDLSFEGYSIEADLVVGEAEDDQRLIDALEMTIRFIKHEETENGN